MFAGSPEAATPSLRLLAGSRHEVAAVVTRDDSPQGRKHVLTPTAVAAVATELGLPVLKANRVGALTDDIRALRPDLGVIVAYGGLIREPLLSVPRLGWINLHFSLLPRWRGAAPVQRAIIAGDEITGATVFQLVPELDAGAVYGQFTQAIGANETAGHLLQSLSDAGARAAAAGAGCPRRRHGAGPAAERRRDERSRSSASKTDASTGATTARSCRT